jgi:hypothetical protein
VGVGLKLGIVMFGIFEFAQEKVQKVAILKLSQDFTIMVPPFSPYDCFTNGV